MQKRKIGAVVPWRVVVALRAAEEWMSEDGCDCGTDEPGTCALCLVRAAIGSLDVAYEGYLTYEHDDS